MRISIHAAFTDAGEHGARCRIYHSKNGLTHWAKSLCEALVKGLRRIDDLNKSADAFDLAELAEGSVEHLEHLLESAREYRRDFIDAISALKGAYNQHGFPAIGSRADMALRAYECLAEQERVDPGSTKAIVKEHVDLLQKCVTAYESQIEQLEKQLSRAEVIRSAAYNKALAFADEMPHDDFWELKCAAKDAGVHVPDGHQGEIARHFQAEITKAVTASQKQAAAKDKQTEDRQRRAAKRMASEAWSAAK